MTDRPSLDELEAMAAGLALGLLESNERAEALRLQLGDKRFAERVRIWQQVGDQWLENIEPVPAPENTFGLIEAELDRKTADTRSDDEAESSNKARFWRGWALTATAASLALTVGLGLVSLDSSEDGAEKLASKTPPDPMRLTANVAQIDNSDGLPLVSALYEPVSGNLSLRLAEFSEPGLAPELWVIPEDGVPRSLGMISEDRLTISISPDLRTYLQDGAGMAITLEPLDGKQHAAPTGGILGTAVLQEVPVGET